MAQPKDSQQGGHGLFYDRSGREWRGATIIRIVPRGYPQSLKEVFLHHFKDWRTQSLHRFEKKSPPAREKKIHASLEKGFTEARNSRLRLLKLELHTQQLSQASEVFLLEVESHLLLSVHR